MERPAGRSWFEWNLSNMVTLLRFAIPIILFLTPFSIEVKLIAAFTLYVTTDYLDGIVARKSGNISGIGKVLDPLTDKAAYMSLPIFLFTYNLIEQWIIISVLVGELFILSLILICLAMFIAKEIFEYRNHSIRGIYRKVSSEMIANINVNPFGKGKIFWYSAGVILTSFNYIFRTELFHSGYLVAFVVGLVFCFVSCIFYVENFVKWMEKFLSQK